jgi:uncharacterized membrane protein
MTEALRAARSPHLLHPNLIGSGAALLIAAFATDLLYWQTILPEWETFSIWLLTAGLILAALAGLALLVDVLLRKARKMIWWRFLLLAAAVLLAILDAFVHSRDGYTAVVPQGLALSAIVTVLLLAAGCRGWNLAGPRPSPSASSEGLRP